MSSNSRGLVQVMRPGYDFRGREHEKTVLESYFSADGPKKLHVGAGLNLLEGWLNTDIRPMSSSVVYLDATEVFPFEDGVFDYVFSEHLIEHLALAEGWCFLRECNRVLKPAGRLRIATPDLAFLIDLYRDQKTSQQIEYIKWSNEVYGTVEGEEDSYVINNFMRDWDHKFIYDEKALKRSLEKANFSTFVRYRVCESDDPELRNMENTGRMPESMLDLETFVIEASKSAEAVDHDTCAPGEDIEHYVKRLEKEYAARGAYIEELSAYTRKVEKELSLKQEESAAEVSARPGAALSLRLAGFLCHLTKRRTLH